MKPLGLFHLINSINYPVTYFNYQETILEYNEENIEDIQMVDEVEGVGTPPENIDMEFNFDGYNH